MTNPKQIERLWTTKTYSRLLSDLLVGRSENFPRVRSDADPKLAAAAVAVLRLDEFNQSDGRLSSELIRSILAAQDADGLWGDPLTTAMCLRALLCGQGNGLAIERGLAALANLQKTDGSFPAEPLRRMPTDSFVTAFIVFELGDREVARLGIRLDEAYGWLVRNESTFDASTRVLWERAKLRCRTLKPRSAEIALWS